MMEFDEKNLEKFQEKIKYKFKNIELLKNSFTHKSYSHENNKNNERLEFLGDSVIGFVITKILFKLFPNYDEGILTKIKSKLCSRENLNKKAKSLNIEPLLMINEDVKIKDRKKNFLGNAYEALIGAMYIDGGIKSVERHIKKTFLKDFKNIKISDIEDPKSYLQQQIQKKYKITPKYTLFKEENKFNEKVFCIQVSLPQGKFIGKGKSKKDAEIDAAKKSISFLKENGILE